MKTRVLPSALLPAADSAVALGGSGCPGASSRREAHVQGREPPEEAALVSGGHAREAHERLAGRVKSKRPKALGLRGLVF